MPAPLGCLHLFCGKIASGKSTLAARLSAAERHVLVSEDRWLDALYGEQMKTLSDYRRFSACLRGAMGPHVIALLRTGLSVVLDFPANTVEQRQWMRDIVEQSGAAHQLHLLDVPDTVCLERLRTRNARGDHPFAVTEDQFRRVSQFYVAPTAREGFAIIRHDNGSGPGA